MQGNAGSAPHNVTAALIQMIVPVAYRLTSSPLLIFVSLANNNTAQTAPHATILNV